MKKRWLLILVLIIITLISCNKDDEYTYEEPQEYTGDISKLNTYSNINGKFINVFCYLNDTLVKEDIKYTDLTLHRYSDFLDVYYGNTLEQKNKLYHFTSIYVINTKNNCIIINNTDTLYFTKTLSRIIKE